MNMISIKKVALGLALSATVIGAKAQKTYTEGTATYGVVTTAGAADSKVLFKGDTSALSFQGGPATVTITSTLKDDYVSVLVDIPVAGKKLIAVASPADLEEMADMIPVYAFTATTETKKIGDYNCTKYIAKDTKTSKTYDLWITKDVNLAANSFTKTYKTVAGTPVQFTYLQPGRGEQLVTLKSISDAKVPAGAFKAPADATNIPWSQLMAMMGGKK
ncbi:MAG: hypothetical protein ABIN91_04430 [Mucilaginibacter sp.]